PVDSSTIDAFFAGVDTIPMLVAVEADDWYFDAPFEDNLTPNFVWALSSKFAVSEASQLPAFITERLSVKARYTPRGESGHIHGIMYGILAPSKNWLQNIDLYDAMLTYESTYQYYADASFQTTLFLSEPGLGGEDYLVFAFPYPDSWAARTNTDGDV